MKGTVQRLSFTHWDALAYTSIATTLVLCSRVAFGPKLIHPELVVVPGALIALLTFVLATTDTSENVHTKGWLGIVYATSLIGLLLKASTAQLTTLDSIVVAFLALQTVVLGFAMSCSNPQGALDEPWSDEFIQS